MRSHPTYSSCLCLTFCLFIFVSSCTPVLFVQNDFNRAAEFSRFQTYAWYPAEASPNMEVMAQIGYSPIFDQRVKAAIASQLLKKGMTPATDYTPDLFIAYDVTVQPPQEMTPPPGFGYGYWYGYRYNYTYAGIPSYRNIQEYNIGTLVIDFIDVRTNELVWRGWIAEDLNMVEIAERDLNKVVANIISQYPPVVNNGNRY